MHFITYRVVLYKGYPKYPFPQMIYKIVSFPHSQQPLNDCLYLLFSFFFSLPFPLFLLFFLPLETEDSHFIGQGGFELNRLICSSYLSLLVAGTQAIHNWPVSWGKSYLAILFLKLVPPILPKMWSITATLLFICGQFAFFFFFF